MQADTGEDRKVAGLLSFGARGIGCGVGLAVEGIDGGDLGACGEVGDDFGFDDFGGPGVVSCG